MKKIFIILTSTALLLINLTGFAQPGVLDSDFDADGKKIIEISQGYNDANAVIEQPDGKILIGGIGSITSTDFLVVRLNPDGSFDNSFGTSGIVTTDIATADDQAKDMVLQPDGKILLGGYSSAGNNVDFALVRYNTDGSLDYSFSYDGIVTTAIDTSYEVISSIALQNDGKIVAGGIANVNNKECFALARYNADGTLDASFDGDGKVVTNISSIYDGISSIALQSDGKIIAVGYVFVGTHNDIALARYNTDGSLDNTFGTNGIVITSVGEGDEQPLDVEIQSDGKIIVTGSTLDLSMYSYDIVLLRYNTDGSLDPSFDYDGIVITAIGDYNDIAYAVAIQPDNKILVAGRGSEYDPQYCDFVLARYFTDGSIDDGFGDNGIVVTPFRPMFDDAHAIALQANGRIIAAGTSFDDIEFHNDVAIARYLTGLNIGFLNFQENNFSSIYPNPIKDNAILEFSIDDEETISIDLYDMNGKLVQQFMPMQKMPAGNHEVNLSFDNSISKGYYILDICNGHGSQKIKLIKSN